MSLAGGEIYLITIAFYGCLDFYQRKFDNGKEPNKEQQMILITLNIFAYFSFGLSILYTIKKYA